MCTESSIKTADRNDRAKIKEIIDLSFPRFFRFFASRSLNFGEGKVLVAETQGILSEFVKLSEFQVGSREYGCIHWIAVYLPIDVGD